MESSVFFSRLMFTRRQLKTSSAEDWFAPLIRLPTERLSLDWFFQLSAHVNHRSCSLQPSSSLPPYPPLGNRTEKKHKQVQEKHEEKKTANLPTRKTQITTSQICCYYKNATEEHATTKEQKDQEKKSPTRALFNGTESLVKALRPYLPSKSSSHPGCRTGLSAPT